MRIRTFSRLSASATSVGLVALTFAGGDAAALAPPAAVRTLSVAPTVTSPQPPSNELFDPAKYPTVTLSNLKDVRLAIKAESLSYVEASISANPAEPRTDPAAKITSRGKPCKTGPSRAALERCRKAFDALTHTVPETAWVDPFQMQTTLKARYLVVTMAGKVWALEPSSRDRTKGFGPIDTPTEAAWVVRSTAIRKEKGGFGYLERTLIKECPMEFQNRAMFISTAGMISVKAEGPIEATGLCT
jgi:hypothetical protein